MRLFDKNFTGWMRVAKLDDYNCPLSILCL